MALLLYAAIVGARGSAFALFEGGASHRILYLLAVLIIASLPLQAFRNAHCSLFNEL